MYLLGGSACILAGYSNRATRDFDFIDLNYSSKLGKVFVHLRDFDMLEYESTLVSPTYKDRAKKLENFEYLNIYVLSVEDIIVSKIIRLSEKDLQDIDLLIKKADKKLINQIMVPFDLLLDLNEYEREKQKKTLKYKKLQDFVYLIKESIDRYPNFKSFIWSLESRGIEGKFYGVLSEEEFNEQVKIINMFLKLSYWN